MADPAWHAGAFILEPAAQALTADSWAGALAGGLGVAMDAASFVVDPIAALASSVVSMLLEHVEPLRTALEELTGSPSEVDALGAQWTASGTTVRTAADDFEAAVTAVMTTWSGEAADSYLDAANGHLCTLRALADECDSVGGAFSTASAIVLCVRGIVRDLVSDLVGKLISWGSKIAGTFGIGAAWVVPDAIATIAKWIERAREWIDNLTSAIRNLCRNIDGLNTATALVLGRYRSLNIGMATSLPTRVLRNGGPNLGDLVPSLSSVARNVLAGRESTASS